MTREEKDVKHGSVRIDTEAPKHVQIVRDDAKSGSKERSIDERLKA